jgi:hypothetical protein
MLDDATEALEGCDVDPPDPVQAAAEPASNISVPHAITRLHEWLIMEFETVSSPSR